MDMLAQRKHPMPEMAAFVAKLRAAFGDSVDEAVSRGKIGEPTFYARGNGRTVGTPPTDHHNVWKASEDVRDRHYCIGYDVGRFQTAIGVVSALIQFRWCIRTLLPIFKSNTARYDWLKHRSSQLETSLQRGPNCKLRFRGQPALSFDSRLSSKRS